MKNRLARLVLIGIVAAGATNVRAGIEVHWEPAVDETTWLPKGNRDNEEMRGDNPYLVDVWWSGDEGDEPRKLHVELRSVSTITGIAGNWGVGENEDFRIHPDENAAWDVEASGNIAPAATKDDIPKDTKVRLVIGSYDYAARAVLRATVFLKLTKVTEGDLGGLPATVEEHPAPPKERGIPLDTDGDFLPNAWEAGKYDPSNPETETSIQTGLDWTRDEDTNPTVNAFAGRPGEPPGSKTTLGLVGDGLLVWEEYRGVFVRGTHRRLDPAQKELFVVASDDIGLAEMTFIRQGAGVQVYFLLKSEVNNLDEVVVNEKNHLPIQRGLYVLHGLVPGGADLGRTFLRSGTGVRRAIVHTGDDGICNTNTAEGDASLIEPGKGEPFSVCIMPKSPEKQEDGLPEKPTNNNDGYQTRELGGDDRYINGFISSGPNGICETEADPSDTQLLPRMTGVPLAPCIDQGDDGDLDTTTLNNAGKTLPDGRVAALDDRFGQYSNEVALSPNETLRCEIYAGRIQEHAKDTGAEYFCERS